MSRRTPWRVLGRWLLLLYPPSFRRRYGRQILEALPSALEQGRRRHGSALLSGLRLLTDLAVGALDAWRQRLVPAGSPPPATAALQRAGDDLRVAARRLRRQPAYALVAILTVAVGVGATTAVFSLVDGALLRPMPYPQADELFFVWSELPWWGFSRAWVSGPQVEHLRRHAGVLEGVAALDPEAESVLGDAADGSGSLVSVARVSGELFSLLGVEARRGRALRAGEEGPAAPRVAVLTHATWQTRFGGAPGIIGRQIQLDDCPYTVVGVMPDDFRFAIHTMSGGPRYPEIFVPLSVDLAAAPAGNHSYALLGRLADGVGPDRAAARLDELATEYGRREYGEPGFRFIMAPLQADLVKQARPALLMLAAGVSLLLLLVCANLATLTLGRVVDGEHEAGLRAALGARGWRRIGVPLMESAWIVAVGGVGGLLLARTTIDGMLALAPTDLPRIQEVAVDGRGLAFSVAATATVALAVALLPLARQRSLRVQAALRAGSGRITGAPGRLQRSLVVVQVALAALLLVGTALVARSLLALQGVDPGFRAGHVVVARLDVPAGRIVGSQQVVDVVERLRQEVLARPGVREAGVADFLPLSSGGDQNGYSFAGAPGASGDPEQDTVVVDHMTAGPGYFAAMGIEVLSGRGFTPADTATSGRVVVIDELAARRFWPAGGAVGSTVHYFNDQVDARVVGVVRHARRQDLRSDGRIQVYTPLTQRTVRSLRLAARVGGDPGVAAALIRDAVAATDPRLVVDDVRPMAASVDAALAAWRFLLQVLGLLASTSLLLAALGTYGVVALSVARRTREIGLRLALGASPAEVGRAVVREGLGLVGLGLGVALVAATAAGRLLSGFLYDVAAFDLPSMATTVTLLLAVGLAAAAIPARRAARVSPMRSLRAG